MISRAWIAALLPAVGAAQPLDEPALGSAFDSLQSRYYACAGTGPQVHCRSAPSAGLTDFGVPVLERVLTYRDARLERMHTTFDERNFEGLLQAIEARLGRGEVSSELLRAGMGGVFTNQLAIWRLPDKVVLLEQYFERVTQSAVSIMEPDAFAALMAARERQRVRGVRDL